MTNSITDADWDECLSHSSFRSKNKWSLFPSLDLDYISQERRTMSLMISSKPIPEVERDWHHGVMPSLSIFSPFSGREKWVCPEFQLWSSLKGGYRGYQKKELSSLSFGSRKRFFIQSSYEGSILGDQYHLLCAYFALETGFKGILRACCFCINSFLSEVIEEERNISVYFQLSNSIWLLEEHEIPRSFPFPREINLTWHVIQVMSKERSWCLLPELSVVNFLYRRQISIKFWCFRRSNKLTYFLGFSFVNITITVFGYGRALKFPFTQITFLWQSLVVSLVPQSFFLRLTSSKSVRRDVVMLIKQRQTSSVFPETDSSRLQEWHKNQREEDHKPLSLTMMRSEMKKYLRSILVLLKLRNYSALTMYSRNLGLLFKDLQGLNC
jgi:hypothetical protein